MRPTVILPEPPAIYRKADESEHQWLRRSWIGWSQALTPSQRELVKEFLATKPYRGLSPLTVWRQMTGTRVFVPSDDAPHRGSRIVDDVMEVIATLPEPFITADVRALLPDMSTKRVGNYMTVLRDKGLLVKAGRKQGSDGFPYRRAGSGWPVLVAQGGHTATEHPKKPCRQGSSTDVPSETAETP